MSRPVEMQTVGVTSSSSSSETPSLMHKLEKPGSQPDLEAAVPRRSTATGGSARARTAGGMAAVTRIASHVSTGANTSSAAGGSASLERVPTYLQPSITVRERLHHFTFAWYTLTMSTSGIALVLGITPHRFTGLDIIGLVIYLLDLVIFVGITVAIGFRFALHRGTFRRALTHPTEALFISTFFLSICALLSNASEYTNLFYGAGHSVRTGMARFLDVAFWIYLAVTFSFSIFQYHLLFTVKPERRLQVSAMTPAWILPIFPVMLSGTLASAISPDRPPSHALAMICAGLAAQGLGFLVSVFMYSTYLSRLMAFGLPAQRPGMFIAVGPPSFTCAAFIAMASDVPRILSSSSLDTMGRLLEGFDAGTGTPYTLSDVVAVAAGVRLMAIASAIFLWGLSFWFFGSAVAATVVGLPDRKFHLSWWSFVFPNSGLTIATIRLGHALGSDGVLWLSTGMTIALVVSWLFILLRCIYAVVKREIVWPGHDEDSS